MIPTARLDGRGPLISRACPARRGCFSLSKASEFHAVHFLFCCLLTLRSYLYITSLRSGGQGPVRKEMEHLGFLFGSLVYREEHVFITPS